MAKQRRQKRDFRDLTGMRVGIYCRVSVPDPNNPSDREKSTLQQEAIGREWIERHGCELVSLYSDEGISASRFGKKARAEFERMISNVAAGKLDLVWTWEMSRITRRPAEFWKWQELCAANGVAWVNKDRVIDPNDYRDMMAAGVLNLVDDASSSQTSERILRDKEALAATGRPVDKTPYGYRRHYDLLPSGKRVWLRDEPNVFNGDDTAVENSPAWVVRRIFAEIAAGRPLRAIGRDLDRRGIPTRQGDPNGWTTRGIRYIAMNPAYVGRRRHHGEVVNGKGQWPPLVTEDVFYAVQSILSDPKRKTTRPSKAKYLLSSLARCAVCGRLLLAVSYKGGKGYRCSYRACTSIKIEWLDAYAEEKIVAWLSDPDVYAALTRTDDSETTAKDRVELNRLRSELDDAESLRRDGKLTVREYAEIASDLRAKTADVEHHLQTVNVPSVLSGVVGADAEQMWAGLELAQKREIIRTIADVRLKPTGMSGAMARWHGPAVSERVEWRWLLGPDAEPLDHGTEDL